MQADDNYFFSIEMDARDHECDIQGVVNNAHYQHYFEHARHHFLKNHQLDFSTLAKQGINLMVQKIEIEYHRSLTAFQQFNVTVKPIAHSKLKTCFKQQIIDRTDGKLIAQAKTIVVPVGSNAKPLRQNPLVKLFNTKEVL